MFFNRKKICKVESETGCGNLSWSNEYCLEHVKNFLPKCDGKWEFNWKQDYNNQFIQQTCGRNLWTGGMVHFTDGTTLKADAILLCTGYKYWFPFLSTECGVTVDTEGRRVNSLYNDVFHTTFTSLCFVGIKEFLTAFPELALQARAIVNVLQWWKSFVAVTPIYGGHGREGKRRLEEGRHGSTLHP